MLVLDVSVRVFEEEISVWTVRLREADSLPKVCVCRGSSDQYLWREEREVSCWFSFSGEPWLPQLTMQTPFLLSTLPFLGSFTPSHPLLSTSVVSASATWPSRPILPSPALFFPWFTWLHFSVFFFFLKMLLGKCRSPSWVGLCVSYGPLTLQALSDSSIDPFAFPFTAHTLMDASIPSVVPGTWYAMNTYWLNKYMNENKVHL